MIDQRPTLKREVSIETKHLSKQLEVIHVRKLKNYGMLSINEYATLPICMVQFIRMFISHCIDMKCN